MAQNNSNGQWMPEDLIYLLAWKKSLSMDVCFSHLPNFCQMQMDYKLASHKIGISTKYHASCKRNQPNDRRPPDCNLQLAGKIQEDLVVPRGHIMLHYPRIQSLISSLVYHGLIHKKELKLQIPVQWIVCWCAYISCTALILSLHNSSWRNAFLVTFWTHFQREYAQAYHKWISHNDTWTDAFGKPCNPIVNKFATSLNSWIQTMKSWDWLGYSNSPFITALVHALVKDPVQGQNLVHSRKWNKFKDDGLGKLIATILIQ